MVCTAEPDTKPAKIGLSEIKGLRPKGCRAEVRSFGEKGPPEIEKEVVGAVPSSGGSEKPTIPGPFEGARSRGGHWRKGSWLRE